MILRALCGNTTGITGSKVLIFRSTKQKIKLANIYQNLAFGIRAQIRTVVPALAVQVANLKCLNITNKFLKLLKNYVLEIAES